MPDFALRTEQITKYFYDPVKFEVLKEVSLCIEKGKFATITGKSGCGKSTLLYILSTMDTDYLGRVYIDEKLVSGKGQSELSRFRNENIGFVFQFHYLLPEFSALENVMLPALKLGKLNKKEIEEKAYGKLKLLGMHEYALKLSSKLSGGQQQRVAIARALINDPKIIMGDEPTGNLDSNNTEIVYDIFRELTTIYHQTIIAVTHDIEFAKKSDMTIEMKDGRIL